MALPKVLIRTQKLEDAVGTIPPGTDIGTELLNLHSDVAQEIADREAAVTTERNERVAADNAEATARANADSAEADARANKDNDLQNQINAASGVGAGGYGPGGNAGLGYGSAFTVPYFVVDSRGRVTSAANRTYWIPGSDNSHCTHCSYCDCDSRFCDCDGNSHCDCDWRFCDCDGNSFCTYCDCGSKWCYCGSSNCSSACVSDCGDQGGDS